MAQLRRPAADIEDTGVGRQKTGIRIGKEAGEVVLEGNRIEADRPLLDERGER